MQRGEAVEPSLILPMTSTVPQASQEEYVLHFLICITTLGMGSNVQARLDRETQAALEAPVQRLDWTHPG